MISEMNLEELKEKRSTLLGELGEATLERLAEIESEVAEIEARETMIKQTVEKRKALENDVIENGTVLEARKGENTDMEFNTQSKEYRSAFFKKLAQENLTEIEERAYTHTTTNYGGALPVETVAQIWSNIESSHAILGDITIYRTGTILELTVHNAITAGDAATVAENAANADENNSFAKVTLSGKDFSKSVEISYALGQMTGGALEQYLIGEISERLGVVLAKDVIATIKAAVPVGNKTTPAALSVTDLGKLFAKVKGKNPVVYVNNATLYGELFGMQDAQKRPLFKDSLAQGGVGAIFGAIVKVEDSLADGEILVGDAKKVVGNFVHDIMIEQDRDIKRHVHVFSGYCRFEAKVTRPDAFALATVTPAGA